MCIYIQSYCEEQWLRDLRKRLENILTLSKLELDEYGHGIIALDYDRDLDSWLNGFDWTKALKSSNKISKKDDSYIVMFVADYITQNGDISINNDLINELFKNLNKKYPKKVIRKYLLKLIPKIEDSTYFHNIFY